MTTPEPKWVPRLVVEALQLDQIREHGGLLGTRDENALESALARAQQRWTYEPETSIPRLAADYAFGLARNHPFRDGNKRIAFITAVVFLGLNGFRLDAEEDDVVEMVVALAAGDLDEEQVSQWLESHSQRQS